MMMMMISTTTAAAATISPVHFERETTFEKRKNITRPFQEVG